MTETGQLLRLVNALTRKLYPQEAPQRRARSGAALADPPDEIARIASSFYQAISWQCDHAPSLDALLELIDPAAHFFQGGDSMEVQTFWSHRVEFWTRRTALSFFQRETSARTLVFGDLGHRFSCYEARLAGGKLAGSGLNGFQLYQGRHGWRIVSVAWDEERSGWPLPEL